MTDIGKLYTAIQLVITGSGRQRLLFSLVVATIAATSIGAAAFPVLFSKGIDALTLGGTELDTGVAYIMAFGIGFGLVGVLEQLQWLTFGPMSLRLQRHLTTRVFKHAIELPYYRLKSYTTYEIGRTVEKGLDAIRDITTNITFFLIPTALELCVAASVIAFMIDLWVAVLLFVCLGLYAWIANISSARIRSATEKAVESGIEAWSFGLDGVANAELLQQANMGEAFINKLNDLLKVNNRAWAVTFRQRTHYGALQAVLFGTVVFGVLWHGSLDVASGKLTIGQLVLINTYIIRLLQPVETFARVYRDVHASLGEAKLLAELLAVEIPSSPARIGRSSAARPYSLKLANVAIKIDERLVLANLNLELKGGDTLFVLGPSGVGKTSLMKMLACLIPPSAGTYVIGGQMVTEGNLSPLREDIAVAQQECLLFDWTIRDNITFGVDGQEAEIDDMIAALGLQEVVSRHLQQDQPTIGERGNRLSGGEKQRISLARALLRKPSLLILDEVTSALDETNRNRVIRAIRKAEGDCTTVMVTHDVSLLNDNSVVLYIASAERAYTGTHSFLLSSCDEYAQFVNAEGSQ